MAPGITLAIALLPPLLLAGWWFAAGRLSQVPGRDIVLGFALGMLAWALALLAGIPMSRITGFLGGEARVAYRAFVLAALLEEGLKSALLLPLLRGELRKPGMVGISLGTGFAFLESAFYLTAPPSTIAFRVLTAVPLHLACAVIAAYSIARPARAGGPSAPGVLAAIALHGLYDYAIFSSHIAGEWALVPLAIAASVAILFLVRSPRAHSRS